MHIGFNISNCNKIMGSEVDTTGIVSKISVDSCHVSVTIDNVQKTFSCSKFLVYACGYQCEGHLTALLDVGTDVEVRYKLSNDNIPLIVAVWCGEIPEHLSVDSKKHKALYDQKGYVIGVTDDSFLVGPVDVNYTVLINKEVIFRDGCRIKNGSGSLSINESVTFDAIPFEVEHPSGALYQATAAWVGQTPRLCDRFGLQALSLLDDPLDNENWTDIVHGVVSVVPNEVVAFAETECSQNSSKVLLMRNSFTPRCENIRDSVDVGDTLCMQVQFRYLFRNTKQWFAVKAWKDGGELTDGSSAEAKSTLEDASLIVHDAEDGACSAVGGDRFVSDVIDSIAFEEDKESFVSDLIDSIASKEDQERFVPDILDKIKNDSVLTETEESGPCESLPARKRTRTRRRKRDYTRGTSTEPEESSSELVQEKSEVKFDKNSPVLVADPPLSGVISIVAKDTASISYNGLKIAAERKAMFHDGKPCSQAEFVILLTTEIREVEFEAVKTNKAKWIQSGFSHEATRVWVGQKPSSTTGGVAVTSKKSEPQPRTVKTNVTLHMTSQPPEINFDRNSPALFYDPPLLGVVTDVSPNFASISYCDAKIYVSYEECYSELQCKKSELPNVLSVFQEVNFEAVKTSNREGYSHEATSVWVGSKPSLSVVSKTLPPMMFSLLQYLDKTFVGVVRKFCLPKVALVVVDDEPTTVCLHVGAFGCKPKKTLDYISGEDCISQFVKLGDTVRFRLTRVPSFFNVLSAIEVEVLGAESIDDASLKPRDGHRIGMDKDSDFSGGQKYSHEARSFPEESSPHDDRDPSRVTVSGKTEEGSKNPVCYYSPKEVTPPLKKIPGIVYEAMPFQFSRPSMMQTWHMKCSGTLEVNTNSKIVRILPTSFSVDYTDKKNPALRALAVGTILDEETLIGYNGKPAFFNAMEKDGVTYVNNLWSQERWGTEGPPYTMYLGSQISSNEIPVFLPEQCRCKIVSIPFHDCAVGKILDRFPVSIPLKSLVTKEDMNPTFFSIDAFLNVGDDVCVEIEARTSVYADCADYLEAVKCWQVVKIRDTDGDDKIEKTIERNRKRWSEMWVNGGLFKEESLQKENDRYVVPFSPKLNLRVTLGIPPENFWVNKKLTTPSDSLLSKEVTFHVAQGDLQRLHIPIAWIGDIPTAVDVLKDKYSVVGGLVLLNGFYEGIIEDFPLPTRAICRIGAVPVLTSVGAVDVTSSELSKKVSVDLVQGTRVLIRVKETCENPSSCCIESTEALPTKLGTDTIVNISGTVTCVPCPVGLIKATSKGLGDIEVSFELASVQIPEDMNLGKDQVRRWFEFLKDFVKVDTPVHFTAIKSSNNKKSTSHRYRAVQVWIDGSSRSWEDDSVSASVPLKTDVSLNAPNSQSAVAASTSDAIPSNPFLARKIRAFDYKKLQFGFSKPTEGRRRWYIGCSGTFQMNSYGETAFIETDYRIRFTVSHSVLITVEDFEDGAVLFDGYVNSGGTAMVTRLWAENSSRPESSSLIESSVAVKDKIREFKCRGKIVSIPFHDYAVAKVSDTTSVMVPFDSLVIGEDVNTTCSSIDSYLNVGDMVKVQVTAVASGDHFYHKAVHCWKETDIEDVDKVENRIVHRQNCLRKWRQHLKTGKLQSEKGKLVVSLDRITKVTVSRDLFFVDGRECGTRKNLVGREVAVVVDPNGGNRARLSWVGKCPDFDEFMAEDFVVPKNVACHNWYYEGVAEVDFAPSHIICRVGALPVLVRVAGNLDKLEGFFKGKEDLKRGTRLSMRVCKKEVGTDYWLVSTETSDMKVYKEVITNLTGRVTVVPFPMGKITTDDLDDDVRFDLASVQIPQNFEFKKKDVFDWFEFLKKTVRYGTEVTFTAVKTTNSRTACYRAMNVWVDEASKFAEGRKPTWEYPDWMQM